MRSELSSCRPSKILTREHLLRSVTEVGPQGAEAQRLQQELYQRHYGQEL